MSDLLTQYTDATEQYLTARSQANNAQHFRRLVLRAMRNDGMTVLQISRLTKLQAGTVAGMLAKVDRDLAELDREEAELMTEPE